MILIKTTSPQYMDQESRLGYFLKLDDVAATLEHPRSGAAERSFLHDEEHSSPPVPGAKGARPHVFTTMDDVVAALWDGDTLDAYPGTEPPWPGVWVPSAGALRPVGIAVSLQIPACIYDIGEHIVYSDAGARVTLLRRDAASGAPMPDLHLDIPVVTETTAGLVPAGLSDRLQYIPAQTTLAVWITAQDHLASDSEASKRANPFLVDSAASGGYTALTMGYDDPDTLTGPWLAFTHPQKLSRFFVSPACVVPGTDGRHPCPAVTFACTSSVAPNAQGLYEYYVRPSAQEDYGGILLSGFCGAPTGEGAGWGSFYIEAHTSNIS
jgi:hypothetical protein